MRVLYVGDSKSIHDLRFLRKLSQKKYEVDVLTMIDDPVRVEGVTYHVMPNMRASTGNRLKDDILYLPTVLQWRRHIRALVEETQPDVLHGGWIPQHGFISALSGFHPFLLMPWGSDVLVLPWNVSRLMRTQYTWTIRKADMITCDAEYVKSRIVELSDYDPNRIVVFPWGVDLSAFNPNVSGDEIRKRLGWEENEVVISTRSLEPIYGMGQLLRAFALLVKKRPEARLLVCGGGSLLADLTTYAEMNGLQEMVRFEGPLNNSDMPKYLAAADLYVSTSLSDGTSLSLLEAMAMNLPVVVSNLPSNREWVRHDVNGLLADPQDILAISQAMNTMLENGEKSRIFGERNLALAIEKADWDVNFGKLESIYRSMTGK
jgi:glycosyltransferase involved in cell wall biosynthesis